MKIKSQKDFVSGLMFIGVGALFAILAGKYSMGTAAKMGAGFFPFYLGLLLAALGALVLLGSISANKAEDKIDKFYFKPVFWVIGAFCVFGVLLQPMGIVISIIALVIISSLGSDEFTWKGTLINTVILLTMCMAVFVYGLKLQFPVWPKFITG